MPKIVENWHAVSMKNTFRDTLFWISVAVPLINFNNWQIFIPK